MKKGSGQVLANCVMVRRKFTRPWGDNDEGANNTQEAATIKRSIQA